MADCIEADPFSLLDTPTLGLILVQAGAWRIKNPPKSTLKSSPASALSVCRRWRDCMLECPVHMASLLRSVHGTQHALGRAAGCTSRRVDRLALLRQVIKTARADFRGGEALVKAAQVGFEPAVRLLLEQRVHAPRADSHEGFALVKAAQGGHEAVVRLLLDWKEHAPRADCCGGWAIYAAAQGGHQAVVCLLCKHHSCSIYTPMSRDAFEVIQQYQFRPWFPFDADHTIPLPIEE